MDQIPATMDRHLDVVQCHPNGGVLLGASSLTGRYWFGSLWYCDKPENIQNLEKCTAGVQLEAGLGDVVWLDNTKILVGLDTGGVVIWELTDNFRTFLHIQSGIEHDDLVTSVSVASSGNKAISGSYDRCVKVWDIETMCSLNTYRGHYDFVKCVKYHPEEPSLFLSCSQDGRTCLWDTRASKPVTVLDTEPLQQLPTYVSWKPNSEYTYAVCSEAGQIVVKDTRNTQGTHLTFTPHKRAVTRLEFESKSGSLASVSEDCTVVVTHIDADSTNQIYCDKSHKDFVKGASWNKSDELLTCGWDSKVHSHQISFSTELSPSSNKDASDVMETNSVKDHIKSQCRIPQSECKINGYENGENID